MPRNIFWFFSLNSICPGALEFSFMHVHLFFLNSILSEKDCGTLLNFPVSKWFWTCQSIQHDDYKIFDRRHKIYLPGSWKYTTVFSTCLCKRAWQIHCYPDFTAVESSTYTGHTGAMVVISSKIWYIYKSIKYHELLKLKVHNPSRIRGIKRHIICILNNFDNVLFRFYWDR